MNTFSLFSTRTALADNGGKDGSDGGEEEEGWNVKRVGIVSNELLIGFSRPLER